MQWRGMGQGGTYHVLQAEQSLACKPIPARRISHWVNNLVGVQGRVWGGGSKTASPC